MALLPLVIAMIALLGLVAFVGREFLGLGVSSQGAMRQSIRDMSAAQRSSRDSSLADVASEEDRASDIGGTKEIELRAEDNQASLQKKLKYAQLSQVSPYVFTIVQIVITAIAFFITRQYFEVILQVMSLAVGPLVVNTFINRRIQQRFKQFDKDYPQFLLSLVGMLKTGLNPIQGLEAAASNLEEKSLVRIEVDLMLERLRLGVSEERSIGSFGEDIDHPEIELFVQALLLSRRVGGNLSDTLDRLARQVRKRQYFRQSAVGAVGLQRGSITFILAILSGLELYLYLVWPESIITTWTDPTARRYAQGGLALIIIGIYWVGQITKIRV
jgi:Flp pilus assembly protein TadB